MKITDPYQEPAPSTDEQGMTKEEHCRTREKIDHLLEERPDLEDLEQRNVLPMTSSTVASSLQGVQKQLQQKMNVDELSHRLETRPDVQELRDHAIVHGDDNVAPSLQATQEKLQRQLNSDKVNQHLTNRPSIEELRTTGLLETSGELAPSLTATAKKLERNLVQNQVSHLLESRPEKEELVSHNILEDQDVAVAPVLQGTKHQLEHQLKTDQVARQLRQRPSVTELEEKGIIDEGELGEDRVLKKCTLSPRARYALALKATSRIAADKLISAEEKSRLKDLILSDDEKIVAALECYEMDENIEEMLDTLYRVAKVSP
ncbi:hypothetical protein KXD40_008423 [Peronospora effusa]|uniref:RPEL repeat protein n=1 Tax=Peronospora effusa TaxID=542832 RepID=A0A3M6V726_9STRA|nr:hypothetical protein DD238_007643 [Peronospora effusa]RQM13484.1 hypothetical protein DD237_005752 [Peronospora effusa]UIZ24543.1 hypothetical protein KXD40_008423 [Peronospora effusa]CAI5715143.1 unnamed protein product [Peronospora effusa]